MARGGERRQRRRTPNTISAPDGSTDPGQWRYRPSVAAASPAARPARGGSSWGTAGRGESTAGAQAIRSLPQMARSTRGTVGIVLPPKPPPQSGGQPDTRPSGTSGMAGMGKEAAPPGPSSIRSLPQMAPPTRGTAGIAPTSQPSRRHRSLSTLGVRRVVRVAWNPPDTPGPIPST